ncbi:[protein-PII] uridylyltransferase [Blastomonas marina]|uniref:[protein-PII] uridylyltransferase n=1 Tax=Blastomonas marina TaxID=1867408 RepID=UPI002AC97786|nr:[protein-PII] uridylyltransferase [Blastomonas marina]WPZ03800.1 [protein-PII] uridylyltransferase [Blastomonas marina]
MSDPRPESPRAIVDRRALTARIGELVARDGVQDARPAIVSSLKDALAAGQAELAQRLEANPGAGHAIANDNAYLIDQLLRIVHDHVTHDLYPGERDADDRFTIMAVGGYGRAEMAPHSDVDIAFIVPTAECEWCAKAIEAILYFLWDLGLTVGQSIRTPGETVALAAEDLTIRTALLEARFVWGERALYEETRRRFWAEVVHGTEKDYVAEKLAERNARHERMGDSRYVVEPNVKEGKGGLRDLQTLYWIGKYIHRVRHGADLVESGLFRPSEYRQFRRAENFFWAVRSHLHTITRRNEDRLTFDVQREVAARMHFADRPGKSAVERFMQYYFLQAKRVGALTGTFLAQLDEQFNEPPRRGLLANFRARKRILHGFVIYGGKIDAPTDDWFRQDPHRLLEIFQLALDQNLEVHPAAMRRAARDAALARDLRDDPKANATFLDILTHREGPETVLRWMNEAGVFGRFVPDFGKVNAQMQFDMYHHYTVDEHTIRAIGLLAKIERGELRRDHPRASDLIHELKHRRALYVAVLLHDIAKGRGGDHSELGAEIAEELCPRFGLDEEETELVAWLVREHLLMSRTAFKRDLADPRTVEQFVGEVLSLERLRLLTILTMVDIRAVGPGTWNDWKRQLIGSLYDLSEQRMRLGHQRQGRRQSVARQKSRVGELLGPQHPLVEYPGETLPDSYWIAEPADVIADNLRALAASDLGAIAISCRPDPERGATLATVIAPDNPGLFYRIAGGINVSGGNIIDARIHTTDKGVALDNFLIQDPNEQPMDEPEQLERLRENIEDALSPEGDPLEPQLARKPQTQWRAEAFDVRPRVLFDNSASKRFTVVEVVARDRPALLYRLGRALFRAKLVVHSAHVATYGERAADVFYVTDPDGAKVKDKARLKDIQKALLTASKPKELEAA